MVECVYTPQWSREPESAVTFRLSRIRIDCSSKMAADTPEENQVVQAETASAKRLGLELQLISLLEQRIAQLEAQIKSSNDSSAEAVGRPFPKLVDLC